MSTTSDLATHRSGPLSGQNAPGRMLGIVGLVCLALALFTFFLVPAGDAARPFLGWVLGATFWLSLLLGLEFLLIVWWLFDAGWPVLLRRQIEHALAALYPVSAVFGFLALLAVAFGSFDWIPYLWMDTQATVPGGHGPIGEDVLYQHKAPYLSRAFFAVRYLIAFGTFLVLAHYLRKWSFALDQTPDVRFWHRSRKLAGGGIFLLGLAASIVAIDWIKSMNYAWFSTMYGVWFFAASFRAGLSALVLLMLWQARKGGQLDGLLPRSHSYFMGMVMLAFTVFWAYITFSQFFLIYSANIPEETFWFNIREMRASDGAYNSWYFVGQAMKYGYFFVPFLLLLWYANKFRWRLQLIAAWLLAFHLLDLYWNILPQKVYAADMPLGYDVRPFVPHASEVLVLVGLGCLCAVAYLRSAAAHRPVPIHDPRILESLHAHE